MIRQAYQFLIDSNGTSVTPQQISDASGWSLATVQTHIQKSWAGILKPQVNGSCEVSLPAGLTFRQFVRLSRSVVLPPLVPTPTEFEFDVALSFAGEDRAYVAEVAEILRAYGLRVFYDIYEQHTLWGKDLYVHLDEVYRLRSRHCVMFLSEAYGKKLWTDHERQSAQARAFTERAEYLLPVRLDDTAIPGIRPTLGYLDGRTNSPADIANAVTVKLGINNQIAEILAIFKARLPGYEATQVATDLVFYNKDEDYTVTLSIMMLREALRSDQLYLFTESSIFVQ